HPAVDTQDQVQLPPMKSDLRLLPLPPHLVERDRYRGIVPTLRSRAIVGHASAFRDSSTTTRKVARHGSNFKPRPRRAPGNSTHAFAQPLIRLPPLTAGRDSAATSL